ncbi:MULTISPECIES: glycosyltransferase 87 family protein [unclassified Clostridium]|uniref:glycosyltransferase 87 family protein n=1 Tax=unclassified Clostridium TaxID=2614128 RepID=UPI000297D0C4|nr:MULTISPECIES: glycosyltransferase 87 family protein [unclassified Clostridium]EKQ58250.1 MAG: putative integral membrane protein [Clostridium sp. Maddingley MBC34-26]
MEKANIKKIIFRTSLVFILLISVFLSIYEVQHYKSSNSMVQNNQFAREGNMLENGDAAPPNMNRQIGNNDNGQEQGQDGKIYPTGPQVQNGTNANGQHETQNQDSKSNGNSNRQKGNNRNMQPGQFNGNMQRGGGDTKYQQPLAIYSMLFLILSCGIYYLAKRKKIKLDLKDEKLILITVLAAGFFLRIAASTLMNGHNDVNLFKNWAQVAANGLSQFYSNARQADYPPFYMYILALIGKLANLSALNPYYVLLLKIPSIIADVATGYVIYKLGKKYISVGISILLTIFYIFNPAIFIDSTFWGQVDSFFTLLVVLAIYLLCKKKYEFSTVIFAISVLMKPQGIIFLPILFFELVRQRKIKNFIFCGVSAIVTAIIIIIPFSLSQQSPLWIFNLYSKTISEYPYASVNAFNFFSLIGANYKNNNTTLFLFSYHTIGMIFIVITTLISWFTYIKGNDIKYISAIALLQIAGVFTFSVGMHERYLFPAVALAILACIYLKDKRFFILAIGFSLTSYLNISTVFFGSNTSIFNILLRATSLLNVMLVIYLVKVLLEKTVGRKVLSELNIEESESI